MEKEFNQLLKQLKELTKQLQYQSSQLQQQTEHLQQQAKQLTELQEIIAAKDAQIAALTVQIEGLTHKKNSRNSSKSCIGCTAPAMNSGAITPYRKSAAWRASRIWMCYRTPAAWRYTMAADSRRRTRDLKVQPCKQRGIAL
ncbi:MAG: hypothetical protein E7317_09220 [Clostridiales bacterium]|nr:hypothetical protein [Clostridiales bacterium]